MTVLINELPGSPKGQYTESGIYVFTRMVRTAWADIDAYAQQLQPASVVVGTQIVQYPGEQFPGFTNFRVRSFEFEPFFGTSDRILVDLDAFGDPIYVLDSTLEPPDYTHAKWTIQYAIPTSPQSTAAANDPKNKDPVPFLEHTITSGGQFLTLGTKDVADKDWYWVAGAEFDNEILDYSVVALEPDVERIAAIIGTTQHAVSWPRIPQPNWLALENYKSHVNESAFTLRGHVYPLQCLLYMGYDARETVMTDGTRAFNLTIKFEGKRVRNNNWVAPTDPSSAFYRHLVDNYGGHNHFWNKSVKAWLRVTKSIDAEHSGPYPTASFDELFQAGA